MVAGAPPSRSPVRPSLNHGHNPVTPGLGCAFLCLCLCVCLRLCPRPRIAPQASHRLGDRHRRLSHHGPRPRHLVRVRVRVRGRLKSRVKGRLKVRLKGGLTVRRAMARAREGEGAGQV